MGGGASPPTKRRQTVKTMTRFVVPLCVALSAALVAHVAIDVAGDFLLPHDTYDALDHRSRGFVACGALALVLCAIAAALRAAIAEARGSEHAFCTLLQRALPVSRLRFTLEILASTFILLLGMEGLDVIIAGQRVDDLTDLLGGSLVLGPAVAIVCAVVCAAGAWLGLRRLAASRHVLAAALATFFRIAARGGSLRFARLDRPIGFALTAPAIARRLAGRAPPPTLRALR